MFIFTVDSLLKILGEFKVKKCHVVKEDYYLHVNESTALRLFSY